MKNRWLIGVLGVLFVVILTFISRSTNEATSLDSASGKKYRILVTHKHGMGEWEMAERIRLTALKLNMECSVLTLTRISSFRAIARSLTHFFVNSYQPDFIISLEGGKHQFSGAIKYASLSHGSDYYFSEHSSLPFERLSHYDGFLVGFPDKGTLKTYFSCTNKLCNYISWYATCPETTFSPSTNFNLFYCGRNMANTSYGDKFKVLFSLLDQTGDLTVYGNKDEWQHAPRSYKGFVKHDGKSILNEINRCGITLVLHAADHYEGKAPTARIFEGAAASSVIISDKHPFVVEHFGDSVLYIDHSSSIDMYDQITRHISWIRENPLEATELARKAHKIFVTNFTLEKQLKNLIHLHENLTLEKYSQECK